MIRLARLRYIASGPTGAGGHLLCFTPETRIRFTAGQHGLWLIPGAGSGPFSIASAPEDETVQLGTALHDGSRLKSALGALQPGDVVRLLGPLGHLAPPRDGRAMVLVTQGIGITPARSLLRQPSAVHRTLIHTGAHHFRDETSHLADRASYPEDRKAFADQLTETAAEQPDAYFLLAGTRSFVRDTARQLQGSGIPTRRIRRDPFYGATERAPRSPVSTSAAA